VWCVVKTSESIHQSDSLLVHDVVVSAAGALHRAWLKSVTCRQLGAMQWQCTRNDMQSLAEQGWAVLRTRRAMQCAQRATAANQTANGGKTVVHNPCSWDTKCATVCSSPQ